MSRRIKKKLALLIGVLVLSLFVAQTQATTEFTLADDPHNEWEFDIAGYSWQSLYAHRTAYTGLYGDFEVTSGTDVTFFIVDQENYDLFEAGKAYSRYALLEDVVSGHYEFSIPRDDDWYLVWSNRDSLFGIHVSIDTYRDETPPTIEMNIDTGASYQGIKEIRVTASDLIFGIWKIELFIDGWWEETGYDAELLFNWDTKDYSNDDHTIKVKAYDNCKNVKTLERVVTVANPVTGTPTPTTTSPTTSAPPTDTEPLPIVMLAVVIGIVVIVAVAIKSRKREQDIIDHVIIP